ncbi:MAG: dipeptidase PepV [Clostridiales bacterium]|nr:dipeptidase PepV [Clostridiales bacterium]
MEFLETVNSKILENRTEMLASLSKLISIPSVAVATEGEKPFGDEVDKAYRLMLEMGEEEGFSIFDADGYGGHIDFDGSEDGVIGVVGHLDVVPEGDGWDFEPYGGEIADGYVYGRGAMDDKGPVIASFYAMKALKQCGFEPAKTIRLILGLDEETGWSGMKYYLERTPDFPDAGFTPDGDFPVIRGEKGILTFDIIAKFPKSKGKGLELSSLTGGTVHNAVPDFAKAVVSDTAGGGYEFIREAVAGCAEKNGWDISCKGVGRSLEISVRGKSAHAAKPDQGVNAISILMDFLGNLTFLNDGTADFVDFYNNRIGSDLHGERIGCAFEDEDSGKLTFNAAVIELDKNAVRLTVNIRYPISCTGEQVYAGIMEVLDEYGYGIVKGREQKPINIDADSQLVSTLMRVYRSQTGDSESEPLVIGGGTYARAFENVVAFGARFPGEPELGHQKNEKISADNMVRLAQIYAEAVYELAKAED